MNDVTYYLEREIKESRTAIDNLSKRIGECYDLINKVTAEPMVTMDYDSIQSLTRKTIIKDIAGGIAIGLFCTCAFILEKEGPIYSIILGGLFTSKIGYDIYCVNKEKKRIATFEEYDSLVNTDILLDEIKNCREKVKEYQFHIIACQKLLGQSAVLSESYIKENSILEPLMEYQEEKIDYEKVHFSHEMDTIDYTERSKKLIQEFPKYK